MTQDFAKRHAKTDNSPKKLAGWVWFIVGLTLGVFGSFVFYVSQVVPVDDEVASLLDKPTAHTDSSSPKANELKWEFHEIFPKSVVPIIEEYGSNGKKRQILAPAHYLLQAGSFRNQKDADKLRAELILIGMNPTIKKITKDGETWHRVLIGPLDSKLELSRARNRLAEASIESIALRVN